MIYSPVQEEYSFFNEDMCRQEVSPYSTFLLFSFIRITKRGVIVDESSAMCMTERIMEMQNGMDLNTSGRSI